MYFFPIVKIDDSKHVGEKEPQKTRECHWVRWIIQTVVSTFFVDAFRKLATSCMN